MTDDKRAPVCVVTGVGPGNGATLSRRFAAGGYRVAMLARSADRLHRLESEIPGGRGYALDVGDPDAVAETFARIRKELGPVRVLVHNAGSGVFRPFLETTPELLEQSWRTNTLALLTCGQDAVEDMLAGGGGAVIVIGATASWRGGANFAPFASAKAAQRVLAQSMARSLGPQGVHVACVIVDGIVDTPATRALLPDRADDTFLQPASIAETAWTLAHQPPDAWTFEIDLRPHGETW